MTEGKCPQRANRSRGTALEYTQMLLTGMTLSEIGTHFGVSCGSVRKALKAKGLPTQSRALLASIPEGCTPTDANVLRVANFALAKENAELKSKLRNIALALQDFID